MQSTADSEVDSFPLTRRYQAEKDDFEMNVWDACAKIAEENNAFDLSQGYADFLPPEHALRAISKASNSWGAHQEELSEAGHPRLLHAITKLFSPRFARQLDPDNEIIVTPGADGALIYSLHGLLNPGDEVIIFDPSYVNYENFVRCAEAEPVFVPLHPVEVINAGGERTTEWRFDEDELVSKFNSKTKILIVNTPHNPTGKVFTPDELKTIANLCKLHDVVVIADEVYEFLVFEPHEHVKMATLDGMWERTITISSAGKLFCATGWRLGWAIGPKPLIDHMKVVKGGMFGPTSCVLQEALGHVLEAEFENLDTNESFLTQLRNHLQPIREVLVSRLLAIGAKPSMPHGGLFVLASVENFEEKFKKLMEADSGGLEVNGNEDKLEFGPTDSLGLRFVRWLAVTKQIAAIPASVFFSKPRRTSANPYVRFCFLKKEKTMAIVSKILEKI